MIWYLNSTLQDPNVDFLAAIEVEPAPYFKPIFSLSKRYNK